MSALPEEQWASQPTASPRSNRSDRQRPFSRLM